MNKTKTNCSECGILIYETLTVDGRCANCNLDYKIETIQLT